MSSTYFKNFSQKIHLFVNRSFRALSQKFFFCFWPEFRRWEPVRVPEKDVCSGTCGGYFIGGKYTIIWPWQHWRIMLEKHNPFLKNQKLFIHTSAESFELYKLLEKSNQ